MRPKTTKYDHYGFTLKVDNGKYSVVCQICEKVLHNTALCRLQTHRRVCKHAPVKCVSCRQSKNQQENHADNASMCSEEIQLKWENTEPNPLEEEFKKEVIPEPENTDYEDLNNESNEEYLQKVTNVQHEDESTREISNSIINLKTEKLKAQIWQIKSETQFFATKIENLDVERTLLKLQVKKLRLEIEILEKANRF